VNVPEPVVLELAGRATDDAVPEALATARAPHWSVTGAATTVYEATPTAGGGLAALSADTALYDNFVDVDATGGFARNDYVVLDEGTPSEEYRQVIFVDGSRLWLNAKLLLAHGTGAIAEEVSLSTQAAGTDYVLTPATGTITEAGPATFGAGHAILVSYTTDFVMPSVYGPPLNDSPDLDASWGEWRGLPLVDGTYLLNVWGARNICVSPARALVTGTCTGDNTSYRGVSAPAVSELLVGGATTPEPYAVIETGAACESCHGDISFHGGGRRGFDTCILCHGASGSEDRARYTAGAAPATTGLTIAFRTMLHKIHLGRDLPDADTYEVVGFGSAPYPNNFGLASYGEVGFPALPGGVRRCETCHGTSTSWMEPAPRDHPSAPVPGRVWRATCGSCHSSPAAGAHIEIMTYAGVESCAVCHSPGAAYPVELMHKDR